MGIPVDATLAEPDYSALSNEALLGILKERLDGGRNEGRQPEAQKTPDTAPQGHDIAYLNPKHRKMIEDAQPQQQAAYDGSDQDNQ